MIEVFTAKDRGTTKINWLESYHIFNFGEFYNPKRQNFFSLRVLNDDIIAGNHGFDMHSHKNAEIVTVLLDGQLEHEDSLGNKETLHPGDIQRTSAGSGLLHAERNTGSEPVHLLQLWFFPKTQNAKPSYETKSIPLEYNEFTTLVSGFEDRFDDVVSIDQDLTISRGEFDAGIAIDYTLHKTKAIFVYVIEGEVEVGSQKVSKGGCAQIYDEKKFTLTILKESSMLFIEMQI